MRIQRSIDRNGASKRYTFSALTAFAVGAVSHAVGQQQGLAQGNLRAGFQGAVTLLLAGGILVSLALLRTAPADMAALRDHVAQRAIASRTEES